MEKTEKRLMKKLARNIADQAPSSSNKEIQRFFQGILGNLPNGDLLATLQKHKKECLQFLIRCVRKTVRKQEAEKTKSVAQKDDDVNHKQSDIDTNGDVTTIPAILPCTQFANISDKHESDVICLRIMQLLQSRKYDTEMGTQIDHLWMQELGSQQANIDKHCVMLTMMYGHADSAGDGNSQIMRNIMQHRFRSVDSDLKSIQKMSRAKAIKRAQKNLQPLVQFLKMCHLRHSYFVEKDTTVTPSYIDLAMALLSIYLDLFIIAHRETEVTKKEQRRMTNLVKKMTWGVGENSLYAMLQMNTADEDKTYERTAYFSLLIRYMLREKPIGTNHSYYLRYILTLCWWRHLWKDMLDVVGEVRLVRAPKGILEWIKRRNPEILEHLPTDRKFKGRTVTAFLLDDADEKVLEMLKYSLVAEEKTTETTDGDEAAQERQQVENGTETAVKEKKLKKKKKKVTITADKEEAGSDGEAKPLFSIDRGSFKEAEGAVSENAVEVFDWTNLTETSETADSSLFMIDRGGKRSSDMVLTEEAPKKKKKKKTSKLTQLPAAQEELDDITEDAPFFIDRGGQKEKTKQQSAVPFEKSKSKQQKKKKEKGKKMEVDDSEKNDSDMTGATSAETSVKTSADLGTLQSTAPWQEPEEKNQACDSRKRTTSVSDKALSSKRKRKTSESAPRAQSPAPGARSEADMLSLDEVEVYTESSSYGSPWIGNDVVPRTTISSPQIADMADDSEVVTLGTAEHGVALQQEDDKQENVSFVPDSFSERDSDDEVSMVPNLNVHLKAESPDKTPDAGSRRRARHSFDDSVISPAYSKFETSAAPPQPVPESESALGLEVKAETEGRSSRRKRNRSSMSLEAAEKEEKPAAVKEQDSEELQADLKKNKSPLRELKIKKATDMTKKMKSPDEGRRMKSPDEGRRMKSPDEGRRMKSPDEGRKMKSPDEGRRMKSPDEGRRMKSPDEGRRMKSPVETKKMKTPVDTKKIKSPVETRVKSPVTSEKMKSPAMTKKMKSPAETREVKSPLVVKQVNSPTKAKNNQRQTEEVKVESSGRDTPQNSSKPKSKTPTSTTPVSRRTRSQRKSVVPTATQPPEATKMERQLPAERAPVVRPKSPAKASDVKTTSPKPSTEASRQPVSVSQNDSDAVRSRKSRRSHLPASSGDADKEASVVPSESSDKNQKTSTPSRKTRSLITALQKKATRKPMAARGSPPASEKELGQEASSAEGSFTKLKSKTLDQSPVSSARKTSKRSKAETRKDAVELKEGAKTEKAGGKAVLPSTPVKASADRMTPQKSPSVLHTSVSPEIQTRSQARMKGYNLRMQSKQ